MSWLLTLLLDARSVPHALLTICLCATIGTLIGGVSIRGVKLGPAGVLFAGLFLGHFGITLEHDVLDFLRDFGLALFVYMTGLSVGPGFFSALKSKGLTLNALALSIVALGAIMALAVSAFAKIDIAAVVGILCGATTNTPSLGAAQQLLADSLGAADPRSQLPGMGYAVSYPLGVAGILGSMLAVRLIFRANLTSEAEQFAATTSVPGLVGRSYEVSNPNLYGIHLGEILAMVEGKVTVSRIKHQEEVQAAVPETVIRQGDFIYAVGTEAALSRFRLLVGREAAVDISAVPSEVVHQTIIVTNADVNDKSLAQLALNAQYGVAVTRVTRGEVELIASPGLRIRYGDILRVVGPKAVMSKVAFHLGNSRKKLANPDLLPVFLGLALGVLLGSVPLALPGVSYPVRLGMAGGPLLVALMVSRLGQIGGLISYFPFTALAALRELGITLFLLCVGLKAGKGFLETVMVGDGLHWMLWGALITVIPLLLVATYARWILKLNMLTIWGVCAGAMTDPPALAFANTATASNAASIAYATVYPVTMLLRIISVQVVLLALL